VIPASEHSELHQIEACIAPDHPGHRLTTGIYSVIRWIPELAPMVTATGSTFPRRKREVSQRSCPQTNDCFLESVGGMPRANCRAGSQGCGVQGETNLANLPEPVWKHMANPFLAFNLSCRRLSNDGRRRQQRLTGSRCAQYNQSVQASMGEEVLCGWRSPWAAPQTLGQSSSPMRLKLQDLQSRIRRSIQILLRSKKRLHSRAIESKLKPKCRKPKAERQAILLIP